MDSAPETASAAGGTDGLRGRVGNWLFLEGDRRLVAGGIVVGFVVVFGSLVSTGVLSVGPGSSVARVFGSGLTAGVVTLLTIALSINQLILSRVFGSLNHLTDRMDGARELRGRVEDLAGQPSSAIDPAEFLSLLARTLADRATAALSTTDGADAEPPAGVKRVLEDVAAYGRGIDERIDPGTPVIDVLGVVVGPEYAINLTAVQHVRDEYGESLPAPARAELRVLEELLEFVAVVRQFFKTIALQQDFAVLSRLLVYTGLLALLAAVSLAHVYHSGAVTVSPSELQVLVPTALGVVVSPLALFAAYILRAATVAHRTVSVGPFVPPQER